MTGNFNALACNAPVTKRGAGQALSRVEKWLAAEAVHLALWIPVGVGIGISIWQFGGADGTASILFFCAAIAACNLVDLVVSDRGLPKTCMPRWVKAAQSAKALVSKAQ